MVKDPGRIPRGPHEWGELFWQESWADNNKHPMKGWFHRIYPYVFMALVMSTGLLINKFCSSPPEFELFIILILVTSLVALVFASLNHFGMIPHRVYENGFVFVRGYPLWGLSKEEDYYIPFQEVNSIIIEKAKYKAPGVLTISILLTNATKVRREFKLSRTTELPIYFNTIRKQEPQISIKGYDIIRK